MEKVDNRDLLLTWEGEIRDIKGHNRKLKKKMSQKCKEIQHSSGKCGHLEWAERGGDNSEVSTSSEGKGRQIYIQRPQCPHKCS